MIDGGALEVTWGHGQWGSVVHFLDHHRAGADAVDQRLNATSSVGQDLDHIRQWAMLPGYGVIVAGGAVDGVTGGRFKSFIRVDIPQENRISVGLIRRNRTVSRSESGDTIGTLVSGNGGAECAYIRWNLDMRRFTEGIMNTPPSYA